MRLSLFSSVSYFLICILGSSVLLTQVTTVNAVSVSRMKQLASTSETTTSTSKDNESGNADAKKEKTPSTTNTKPEGSSTTSETKKAPKVPGNKQGTIKNLDDKKGLDNAVDNSESKKTPSKKKEVDTNRSSGIERLVSESDKKR